MSLQKRVPSDSDNGAFIVVNEKQEWNPKETAIIICDMWNEHWCKGATVPSGKYLLLRNYEAEYATNRETVDRTIEDSIHNDHRNALIMESMKLLSPQQHEPFVWLKYKV